MSNQYAPVIGLEIHAEIETKSKMFCPCRVVDFTRAAPNTAVCPVCAGMPGMLPVLNKQAVEAGIRVALALGCEVANVSIFSRKNYFYPDLPKGYQISQYDQPLARNGQVTIHTSVGPKTIRIRRVHLEEDTGKLTHIQDNGESYSLVDLNRAGIPLLEIVSEPDIRSAEEASAYARAIREILIYLGINSGIMQKGVLRIEPNISVRQTSESGYGTRTEIKNLNSFRALERSVGYEIKRQVQVLESGQRVIQQTMGWDEKTEITFPQRSKEGEEDYRYFPEPDLPPLVVDDAWVEELRSTLLELPAQKYERFRAEYTLNDQEASILVGSQPVSDFFDQTCAQAPDLEPKLIANWITGELFNLLYKAEQEIIELKFSAGDLAGLLTLLSSKKINNTTAKTVLREMFKTGKPAEIIIREQSLAQITNRDAIAEQVANVIKNNPSELESYLAGKETIQQWFFGQVMRQTRGKADPKVVQEELTRQLNELKPR